MNEIGAIIGAVLCNVLAQIMMKFANKSNEITASSNGPEWFTAFLNPWIFIALCSYGLSFLLTTIAYRQNSLSIISPLMAGTIIGLTVIAGHVLFKEPLSIKQFLGFLLIASGILLSTA